MEHSACFPCLIQKLSTEAREVAKTLVQSENAVCLTLECSFLNQADLELRKEVRPEKRTNT